MRTLLSIVLVLAAIYVYSLIREAARLAACALLGIQTTLLPRARGLLGLQVRVDWSHIPRSHTGIVILAGPVVVLGVGYIMLVAIRKRGALMPDPLRIFSCVLCYLALMLDPIYYAVIPLVGLGGEPSAVAVAWGAPVVVVQIAALAILVINTVFVRKDVVPLLRPF
jgi:hypothetical protein